MTQGANDHLWFRILALYQCHDFGALLWCDCVSTHSDSPWQQPVVLIENAKDVAVIQDSFGERFNGLLSNQSINLRVKRLCVIFPIIRMMTALMAVKAQRYGISDAIRTFLRKWPNVMNF